MVAICDVCGEEADSQEANICWNPTKDEDVGDTHYFRIACKDKCTEVLDSKYGHQYTHELETGIMYLMHNIKMDLKRAKNSVRILSMLD